VNGVSPPKIVSEKHQLEFEEQAISLGLNPNDPWIGGYVDYEWNHLRHILNAYRIEIKGLNVLEFGCNVGASSILYSHLGAKVFAIDVAPKYIKLAQLNAKMYGIDDIKFLHVENTKQMPFGDNIFDFISCNSVLEYVKPSILSSVQKEIGRTLKVGGKILVTGTSNRLWPKEVHSRKWFINYLPRIFDHTLNLNFERGVFPWEIRYGFGNNYENLDFKDQGNAFILSRFCIGENKTRLMLYSKLLARLGIGPGLMAQNISCLLKKIRLSNIPCK